MPTRGQLDVRADEIQVGDYVEEGCRIVAVREVGLCVDVDTDNPTVLGRWEIEGWRGTSTLLARETIVRVLRP
jgi:hypothetical protein